MEEVINKKTEKKEIIYHNFLNPGKIVKIVPVNEKVFSNQTVESLPESFMLPKISRRLELRPDKNGGFVQIFDTAKKYLTAEFPEEELTELEWFSRMKGRDLNVHKPEANFWAGWMNKANPTLNFKPFEVNLPTEGKDLDLGTVEGMLEYKVLLTNTHKWIAPSWAEKYNRPTYWFALIDEKVTIDRKTEKMNLLVKANSEFMVIKDHRELLMEFLIVKDPNNVIAKNVPMDFLVTQVYDVVENNPKLFLEINKDENKDEKVLAFKAVRSGAVRKSGDKYYTIGDEPLGQLGEFVALLKDPTKIEFRKKIEFQVENHYNNL